MSKACMSKAAVFSGSLVVRAMCRILAMAVSIARVAGRVRFIHDPGTGTLVPEGPSRLTAYIYHQGRREKSTECYRGSARPHACLAPHSVTAAAPRVRGRGAPAP